MRKGLKLGGRILILVFAVYYFESDIAQGAQNSFNATVTVAEEYNDNIHETRDDRQSDSITRVSPGFVFDRSASLWDWSLSYYPTYEHYAKSNRNELYHYVNLSGLIRPVEDFLFIEIQDSYSRAPLDNYGDSGWQDMYANQTDQNFLSVNPYVLLHPSSTIDVKAGYTFRNIYYSNSEGIGRTEHEAAVEATHELTDKTSALYGFSHTWVRTSDLNYRRFTPTVGIRNEYAPHSYLTLRGGYTWYTFDNGLNRSGSYWEARINRTFGTMNAEIYSMVTYNTDSRLGASESRNVGLMLEKEIHRGKISFSAAHVDVRDMVGDNDDEYFWYGVRGSYALTPKLTADGGLTEYDYQGNNIDRDRGPVRVQADAGLGYELAPDISLGVRYIFTTYRDSIGSSADAIDVNRFYISITKQLYPIQ